MFNSIVGDALQPGHPEPLLRPCRHGTHVIGGIVLGFQRCPGPYLPTCQACSTQIGCGRVLYLQRALRLGLFFVEFVAAARRHNTHISVRLGASSRYRSAPLPRSSAHALHTSSHKAFRTSAAHKRSIPIAGSVLPAYTSLVLINFSAPCQACLLFITVHRQLS